MWNASTYVCVCVCVCAAVAAAVAGAARAGPLRCALAPPRCSYVGGGTSENEHEYSLDGNKIIINYLDDKYLQVDCGGWAALESGALPAFPSAPRVPAVTLSACPPPASAALADALAALNVTLLQSAAQGNLSLLALPPTPPLAAQHFAGLERLVSLKLIATARGASRRPAPRAGFLGALRSLRSLVVVSVLLPPDELAHAPASLRVLSLRDAGVLRLPPAVLALPALRDLVLSEREPTYVAMPASLRSLSLSSPRTNLTLDAMPALETLTLVNWAEREPKALNGCVALRHLQLTAPAAESLPARWVAACPRLERLVVMGARALTALPERLLRGARALAHVRLSGGVLATLPRDLLQDLPTLRTLDVSANRLLTLPSGLFAGAALEALNLSLNLLEAPALRGLAALGQLARLNLSHNARLGDLCDGSLEFSPITSKMTKLESLNLYKTNITCICRDWRENLVHLKTLDLRHTQVSELWYSDLQYSRAADGEVLLQGAPVARVRYSREDYSRALAAPRSRALVQLDAPLRCDCDMYWTWRARPPPAPAPCAPTATRPRTARSCACAASAPTSRARRASPPRPRTRTTCCWRTTTSAS